MRKLIPVAMLVLGILFSVQIALADSANVSTVVVQDINDGSVIDPSSSQLVRNAGGLSYSLATTGLQPGGTYSIWLIVFNNDVSFARITNVGGGLAGPDGRGHFAGHFSAGEAPAFDGVTTILAIGDEFEDPFGANVRLIVRSHGAKISGLQHEQTSTISGGCPPNNCSDKQIAIH